MGEFCDLKLKGSIAIGFQRKIMFLMKFFALAG